MVMTTVSWLVYMFVLRPIWWMSGEVSGRLVPDYSIAHSFLNIAFSMLIIMLLIGMFTHTGAITLSGNYMYNLVRNFS